MNSDFITAETLLQRYSMSDHPENGAFLERHYPHDGAERASSGSIYYYVAPGERTAFHRIDCDEYWCYVRGAALEVWAIAPDGALTVHRLGVDADCEPLLYLKKGVIFASRHADAANEGTFLSCITVPRFTYAGFEMFTPEKVQKFCPGAKAFFADSSRTNGGKACE